MSDLIIVEKVQCCTLYDFIQRKDITVVNCKIMIENMNTISKSLARIKLRTVQFL